jgi:mannose-6-phosphate isomerase
MVRLKNPIKHYDWGSPEWIPQLLGEANPQGLPWAELWMGVHPEGPSRIEYGGSALSLFQLIDQDPARYLGEAAARAFGTLPFLFKLLAAEKPLSIQAHPNQEQAQQGWERENQLQIPLDAPQRNYKDPQHKPEIICALSPFKALCGFREPERIVRGLVAFSQSAPEPLGSALGSLVKTLYAGDTAQALRAFLQGLFGLPREIRQAISAYGIHGQGELIAHHAEYQEEWKLLGSFAALHPEDPAVLAPLYLNRIDLAPGEGIYLPAGVLHAYIRGFGVELMASSDNVLRGGLTAKHVDTEELVRILDFAAFHPQVLKPQGICYPTPAREFSLWTLEGSGDQVQHLERLPVILIVTQGTLRLSCAGEEGEWILHQGASVFISAAFSLRPEALRFSGTYTLYAAGIGCENTGGC